MKLKGYVKAEDLFYSCIYGSGVYESRGRFVQDPLGGDNGEGQQSPLLRNIITGEEFYMKRLNCNDVVHNKYRGRILNPPSRTHILWPSDLINLKDKQTLTCSLFVAQEYTETPLPIEERQGNRALLFPYGGYPKMMNGIRRLSQIKQRNWKNSEIRKIAIKILSAIESVNRGGYVYEDIHLSRFFFKESDDVYLNFSDLTYFFGDLIADDASIVCSPEEGSYPIEFAEPSVIRGLQKTLDFQSQNYSICALLFYLFFDQYAYDGRLLTGYVDDSVQKHYIKFRDYHKMPVFIFDPEDKQNALGTFDEEQQIIDLWTACPLPVRELFIATLKRENAERTAPIDNPTPEIWFDCFEKIGWIDKNVMTSEVAI